MIKFAVFTRIIIRKLDLIVKATRASILKKVGGIGFVHRGQHDTMKMR